VFQRVPLPQGESLALDATAPAREHGTALVYLHGLGSDRGGEKARFLEARALERGFGFARFDFRGHGESSGRFEGTTFSRHLEDVAAVLGHLRSGAAGRAPGRVVLVGASFGAVVAAWHALLQRGTIAAQILIAPAFRIIERYLAALGDFGRARWQREGTYRFVGPWFQFDLDWSVIEDAVHYPPERLERETTTPTLLIHGTADGSAPFAMSERFAAACPVHPRLVAIECGDHRLTAHKERVADELFSFLAQPDFEDATCRARAGC
jgi:pimeloyl-ACP methyl ester carboxylesterase